MENFVAPDDDAIRPIVLVRIRNIDNDVTKVIYAMLDTCSDKDVISEGVVDQLELKQVTKDMTIQTVETKITQKRQLANFAIESIQTIKSRSSKH